MESGHSRVRERVGVPQDRAPRYRLSGSGYSRGQTAVRRSASNVQMHSRSSIEPRERLPQSGALTVSGARKVRPLTSPIHALDLAGKARSLHSLGWAAGPIPFGTQSGKNCSLRRRW
jgi:hypothetical protein